MSADINFTQAPTRRDAKQIKRIFARATRRESTGDPELRADLCALFANGATRRAALKHAVFFALCNRFVIGQRMQTGEEQQHFGSLLDACRDSGVLASNESLAFYLVNTLPSHSAGANSALLRQLLRSIVTTHSQMSQTDAVEHWKVVTDALETRAVSVDGKKDYVLRIARSAVWVWLHTRDDSNAQRRLWTDLVTSTAALTNEWTGVLWRAARFVPYASTMCFFVAILSALCALDESNESAFEIFAHPAIDDEQSAAQIVERIVSLPRSNGTRSAFAEKQSGIESFLQRKRVNAASSSSSSASVPAKRQRSNSSSSNSTRVGSASSGSKVLKVVRAVISHPKKN